MYRQVRRSGVGSVHDNERNPNVVQLDVLLRIPISLILSYSSDHPSAHAFLTS